MQRYNALVFEKLVRKQLFSLINNEVINKQFVEVLSKKIKNYSQTFKALSESYQRKIEKLKLENEKLAHLIAKNPLAEKLESLLSKIKDNEDHISQLKAKKQELEINSLNQIASKNIDSDFILSGIKSFAKIVFAKLKFLKNGLSFKKLLKLFMFIQKMSFKLIFGEMNTNLEPLEKNPFNQELYCLFVNSQSLLKHLFIKTTIKKIDFQTLKKLLTWN